MSALDQAFIRAYAKDVADDASPQEADRAASPRPLEPGDPYLPGTWYRIDPPAGAGGTSRILTPQREADPTAARPPVAIPSSPPSPIPQADAYSSEQEETSASEPYATSPSSAANASENGAVEARHRVMAVNELIRQTRELARALEATRILVPEEIVTEENEPESQQEPVNRVVPEGISPLAGSDDYSDSPIPRDSNVAAKQGKHSTKREDEISHATQATTAETSTAKMTLLSPAWEVDRLAWPPICDKLLAEDPELFAELGQRLTEASKEGLNFLAVTGVRRGEGRTTLAMCLARVAALAGARVVLIDGDLENPQLAEKFGLRLPAGWEEVFAGRIPWEEAIISSMDDRISLAPLGDSLRGASTIHFDDPDGNHVLRELISHFDLAIVDAPPYDADVWLGSRDGTLFDAAILVKDMRFQVDAAMQAAAGRLRRCGIESLAIAENFAGAPVAPSRR